MASYLRDIEREGLPAIDRRHLFDSPRPSRITSRVSFDDDVVHRVRARSRSRSPSIHETVYQPRPPSPSQRRMVTELQDQVKTYKEEMRKKDSLIQQLAGMDSVPKVAVRSAADSFRQDTIYLGDRHAIETARSELASYKVKNEKLQMTVSELKSELEVKEISLRELKTKYESSKENEARLSALLESHSRQILELEGKAGSYETAVGRSEFTVSALQQQIREGQEKILELEGRLRTHLANREGAEVKVQSIERRFEEFTTQLSSLLNLEISSFTTHTLCVEEITRKITDLMQENTLLKGKLVTLSETLNSTELESKASRETIMRLVSEVGKEQKVSTRFTTEIDNLRMERDNAISDRRSLEREVEVLTERLAASNKALNATRSELDISNSHISSLDREYRNNTVDIRTVSGQHQMFKEQLICLLSSEGFRLEMSEDAIKRRITELVHCNREMTANVESLQDRIKVLTEQLENQYELHKTAAQRARTAENDIGDLESRLRSAEGELAAGDVLRDGLKGDKQQYLRCLQELGNILKVDKISADLGLDMTIEAITARAEQLVRLEKDAIADKSTHIYNLQRKVKSLKEQLESKDLHIDLLRKKLTSLEEKILSKSVIERERDSESYRVRKLEKLAEKYKLQNCELRQELTNMKAQLLGSSDLKIHTMEQRKEIDDLMRQVDELEQQRTQQSQKIARLKGEVNHQGSELREKNVVADNAVQALSSELRTTKTALQTIQSREKQLLDFRLVVARMLGLNMNTLAVPDYEIISRLEKLIQAHHNHAFTTMSMEEALVDMESDFLSGLEDYYNTSPVASANTVTFRRARDRARRKSARARARSASPVRRRDTRVY